MTTDKKAILARFTEDEDVALEVLLYVKNAFEKRGDVSEGGMADEPFTELFRQVIAREGGSETQRALDGLFGSKSVKLSAPGLMELYIHRSFAGDVPVIFTKSLDDFEKLVCELAFKGVFSEHIKNMGASFLYGKSKAFVILSNKPYSNVPAAEVDLDDEVWERYSAIIRREHECLHYYTRKFYGGAHNHLHDELIADFVGIISAVGTYSAKWFLKFLGIGEDVAEKAAHSTEYLDKTAKKRFDIYTEGLSTDVADVMKSVATEAAYSLEKYFRFTQTAELPEAIDFLCGHDLLELADGGVFEKSMKIFDMTKPGAAQANKGESHG